MLGTALVRILDRARTEARKASKKKRNNAVWPSVGAEGSASSVGSWEPPSFQAAWAFDVSDASSEWASTPEQRHPCTTRDSILWFAEVWGWGQGLEFFCSFIVLCFYFPCLYSICDLSCFLVFGLVLVFVFTCFRL